MKHTPQRDPDTGQLLPRVGSLSADRRRERMARFATVEFKAPRSAIYLHIGETRRQQRQAARISLREMGFQDRLREAHARGDDAAVAELLETPEIKRLIEVGEVKVGEG